MKNLAGDPLADDAIREELSTADTKQVTRTHVSQGFDSLVSQIVGTMIKLSDTEFEAIIEKHKDSDFVRLLSRVRRGRANEKFSR